MAIDKNFIMGYGAGKASKTSQTIIEETDAWLEENISQETGYVLDRTLSMENAAAPADLVGDLKSALNESTNDINDLDAEINGLIHLADEKFLLGKSLSGTSVVDSTNTILVYNFDIEKGQTLHLDSYSTYKYYIKVWKSNTWADYAVGGSAVGWLTKDYTILGNEKLSLYVRHQDNSAVSETDRENIIDLFSILKSEAIISEIDKIGNKFAEYSFVNIFDQNSIVALPSDFESFPISVNVSCGDHGCGCDLSAYNFKKNNQSYKTYFVSPKGNDANNGLTPDAPLLSIATAINKSDVNTIILLPGEYKNGVNFSQTTEINKEINIIGKGKVSLSSAGTGSSIKITSGCYIENVIFDGGLTALTAELEEDLCVFVNCKILNSSEANGFTALGGIYIMQNCEASNNKLDGFNYHSNNSYKPKVLEIGCFGYNNGLAAATDANNCSTIHENGSLMVRVGCNYGISKGGIVADADGAYSANFGVTGFSTQNFNTADRAGNFAAIGSSTKMWLYNCESFGSQYDIIADAGTIYTTDTYQRERTVNSGTISILT